MVDENKIAMIMENLIAGLPHPLKAIPTNQANEFEVTTTSMKDDKGKSRKDRIVTFFNGRFRLKNPLTGNFIANEVEN